MSPHWIDAVIALTVFEGAGLWWWSRSRVAIAERAAMPRDFWRDFWLGWLSGLCLMASLRGAVAGWGPAWVLGCLAAAGLVHAVDLRRRWRRS